MIEAGRSQMQIEIGKKTTVTKMRWNDTSIFLYRLLKTWLNFLAKPNIIWELPNFLWPVFK